MAITNTTMLNALTDSEIKAQVRQNIKAAYLADSVGTIINGDDTEKADSLFAFLNGSVAQTDNPYWFTDKASWDELLADDERDELFKEVCTAIKSL